MKRLSDKALPGALPFLLMCITACLLPAQALFEHSVQVLAQIAGVGHNVQAIVFTLATFPLPCSLLA